ncbi:hypothetical protein [Marisediminicola sp. LYQ85]|uniref:hypothetical protein n=1 Tax=Marisediminicola sp. LYQ85 TaxID=3391062 RepID=UPI003983863D
MRARFRSAGATIVAVSVMAVLAGCVGGTSDFAVLEREPGPGDALPDLPGYAFDDLDMSSARFVGEHDGTDVWLARSGDSVVGLGVCLIVSPEGGDWHVACGGTGQLEIDGPGGRFEIRPDDSPTPEGATAVSENVFAFD